jgi:bacillithiol system protein YtxJ
LQALWLYLLVIAKLAQRTQNLLTKHLHKFAHKMNWIPLSSEQQFLNLLLESNSLPVAVFKHSTRCSVSSMAKRSLESAWQKATDEMPIYYLDLLQYRNISNLIATNLNVIHQSPQLIIIKNGKAVYHASHSEIDVQEAVESVLQK